MTWQAAIIATQSYSKPFNIHSTKTKYKYLVSVMFNFIDLFSGIGGFHIACSKNNGICKAACDIDPIARKIYKMNFIIQPHDDIKTMPVEHVNLICAGFPCQPYSLLGKRKGSKDSRGMNLFKYLARYLKLARPDNILLENVKGIVSIDNGAYFRMILNTLQKLGYHVTWKILNSADFSLPQNRERIYIVGSLKASFDFDKIRSGKRVSVASILDVVPSGNLYTNRFDQIHDKVKYDSGFVLRSKINNYTHMKLFSSDGITGTLATASPPIIYDERVKRERHLSPVELLKLQGFPKSYKFPADASRSTYVHYLGNSVSVPVIDAIVKEMMRQKLF